MDDLDADNEGNALQPFLRNNTHEHHHDAMAICQ
jgi:hypothetical protein